MDTANLVAAWLSTCATAIGLGSLTTQSIAIRDQMDPFHETRRGDYMGVWTSIQPSSRWYTLIKPTPLGPVIAGNLDGCLGQTTIHLSRRPTRPTGKPMWTALLAVFHPPPIGVKNQYSSEKVPDKSGSVVITMEKSTTPSIPRQYRQAQWPHLLEMRPLTYHQSVACVKISRQTLITFILLSQARQIYRYSSAAGLRLAYAGYNGSYQIEWPLGGRPVMTFAPHQGISREKDNYPEVFARRPRKCIEMGLGVISFTDSDANDKTKIAFAGRKPPGRWVLERLQNRFSAQRTAADQYNEMGGQAHEVDYLFRRRLEKDDPEPPHALKLSVPSLEDDEESILYLAQEEVVLVASCLDHLPWSPLAWSIHRGMKDVLVAYGKQTMKAYRNDLAEFLRQAVKGKEQVLADQGWPRKFAEDYMASQAASAILGDEECSGDVCRIVSAVALLEWDKDEASLDQTTFWRSNVHVLIEDDETQTRKLTPDMVIALVKLFFVQWSHEFNYGMCFDIPYELTLS